MVSRRYLQPTLTNSTEDNEAAPSLLAPKSAITVGIALVLLLLGIGMAKLLNRYYIRSKLRDDVSDVSDHTRHLLRLQKSSRRGLLTGSRRGAMSEAERIQWQMTVLSMWQSRSVDDDELNQDEHTKMLSRLRSAWLSRRRGHRSANPAAATSNGRTAEQLQADVRRVALAWLERSRAATASATLRGRRRQASHEVMMRRLSLAWQQHRLAQDRMGTIDEMEGGGSDGESYATVELEAPEAAAVADECGEDSDSEVRPPEGEGYSCKLL